MVERTHSCGISACSTEIQILDPVYTRAKVSGFVKISGLLVFQVYGVYTAQPHTMIVNT